jgi:acyl homoserine lactone synthase
MAVAYDCDSIIVAFNRKGGSVMIRVMDGQKAGEHRYAIEQMFRLRKRVFHERLKWDVNIQGEFEIDSYDALRPLYVLSMNERTNQVVGSLRLLPTTGPNMLAEIFPELLPEGQLIRNPTIWESSRYCVDTELAEQWGQHGVHRASAELLLALCEIGIEIGLTFIVTVIDLRMERILRRLNCAGDRIGEPHKFGAVTAIAGLWETSEEMLEQLRTSSGITSSVLHPSVHDVLRHAA